MQHPPLLLRDDIEQYPPFLPRDDIEQYVPTREQTQFIFLHHYNVNSLTMSRGYCKISSSSFEGGQYPPRLRLGGYFPPSQDSEDILQ